LLLLRKTMLGEAFLEIAAGWRGSFARVRSFERSIALALGLLCAHGRATTSSAIVALGNKDEDWSADYKLFSRAPWKAHRLFDCAVEGSLPLISKDWAVLAFDDTRLKKSGKKIAGAQYFIDPCAPCKAFHPNLMYGLRFLQCSLLVPLHDTPERGARAVPISFEHAPCAKKPGKKASLEEIASYKKSKTQSNLSTQFASSLRSQRERLDEMGARDRLVIATVDGSFCNKACLTQLPDRTVILGRTRKDAKLCFAEPCGSRRTYCLDKFSPESVLKDQAVPFKTASVVFGGAQRELKYKQVENVLWQGGAKTRRLTLLVLAPTPYRVSPNGPRNYRDPAFLLCTAVGLDAQRLLQAYLDRWQIECNHKDEKDILGVGQAQVWSQAAIPRQPAFAVAAYSILLLATLQAFGPGRTNDFPLLPKWRKQQRRPSLGDMLTVLRAEFNGPNSAITQRLDKNRPAGKLTQRKAA
jgi:hypothetical protein